MPKIFSNMLKVAVAAAPDVLVCLHVAACAFMLCSLLRLTSKARTARDVINARGFHFFVMSVE